MSEHHTSLIAAVCKYSLLVILIFMVWAIPIAVVAVLNNGTQILRYGANLDFPSIFEEIYEASPLPNLIAKAMSKKSSTDLELGSMLFKLLMGLPVCAILQRILSMIGSILGKPMGAVAADGKYKAAIWTGIILTKAEAAWYVFVNFLVQRYYGKQNVYLVMITAAILLVWVGYELMKHFGGYSYIIKSLLLDLLNGILEMPVLALLSACMLLVYSQIDTMPHVSAAMVGIMLLVEWLYSKTTLFYIFRIGCFAACIFMSGYIVSFIPA